jgi:membrane protein implicated in regulation of membrane protease activity
LDAVGLALGAFLFQFGVVLTMVGLSTPSFWGCTVYGVVLSLLGAAAVAYSAEAREQSRS